MGVYYFPSEFVFWMDNPKHSEMKDKLMNDISNADKHFERNTNGVFNARTSYTEDEDLCKDKVLFLNEPHVLQELVYKPFEKMIEEYNSRKNVDKIHVKKCIVESGWYTKYESNGSFGVHNHEDFSIMVENDIFKSSFSFIYILNDKNEANSTEFIVPSTNRTSALDEIDYSFDTGDVPEIREGTVMVFPSSLYHQVRPSKIPGRVTISYNMRCCYTSP
jgi:ectoine hydroxylase-related dioxygenase (phytanoyl-CoA dioxygenase family)